MVPMTEDQKKVLKELETLLKKLRPNLKIVLPKFPKQGFQPAPAMGSNGHLRTYEPFDRNKVSLCPFRVLGNGRYTFFVRSKWKPWAHKRMLTVSLGDGTIQGEG